MNSKEGNRAVIHPVKGRKSPDLGPFAVMVSSEKDLRLLRNMLPMKDAAGVAMSRIYTENTPLPRFSVSGPVITSPYAAMVMEPLIAFGAEEILFFGWCGALSPGVKIGDIIIPDGAITDEGTSLHYQGRNGGIVRPSPVFSESIRQTLRKRNLDFHEGLIWTTDAVYRETHEKIRYFQARNALAVEMELSAFFTIGNFRKRKTAAILVVSDELSTLRWHPGFANDDFIKTRKTVAEIIVSLCRYSMSLT